MRDSNWYIAHDPATTYSDFWSLSAKSLNLKKIMRLPANASRPGDGTGQ